MEYSYSLLIQKAYIVNLSFYSGFVFYPSKYFLTEILLKLLISNLIWDSYTFNLVICRGFIIYELPLSKTIKNIVRYLMAISLILVVILSLASV